MNTSPPVVVCFIRASRHPERSASQRERAVEGPEDISAINAVQPFSPTTRERLA
jgi:hypothetical protein